MPKTEFCSTGFGIRTKFGTNYRIVNMVAILQIATIILSRGDMYVLGEAYAFGVIWSFVFKTLSVLVLRYKHKYKRLWRVPLNLKFFRPGGQDFPLGLALTFLVLFMTAVVNLFTKEVATIAGISSQSDCSWCSRSRRRSTDRSSTRTARNRRSSTSKWSMKSISTRHLNLNAPIKRIIAIRDPLNLAHLHRYLAERDSAELIAVTVRSEKGLASSDGGEIFTDAEQSCSAESSRCAKTTAAQ